MALPRLAIIEQTFRLRHDEVTTKVSSAVDVSGADAVTSAAWTGNFCSIVFVSET